MDMIEADISLVGGISEAIKIAHLAHAFDMGQAHTCGSLLPTAIAFEFEVAIPNFEIHEHQTNSLTLRHRALFKKDLQPLNARLAIPTKLGFGMTLSKDAEKRMIMSELKLG